MSTQAEDVAASIFGVYGNEQYRLAKKFLGSDWLAQHDAALLAERDALAERVERVKALADEWDEDQNPHAAWLPIDFARALRAALDVSPEAGEGER